MNLACDRFIQSERPGISSVRAASKVVESWSHTHLLSVNKPAVQNTYIRCRSRKSIRWHIPVHPIFGVFHLFFLPVLCRPCFTSRTTKTRRQSNSSTFYNPETFMSSMSISFVHATLKRSQKVPHAKSGTFWFPWMDSHD